MYTERLSEALAVVTRLKPQSVTAAATGTTSDAVDMKYYRRVLFVFNIGDYAGGNDGSVAAGVYGDTASGGSYTSAVTGKTITTASFTGSAQDDAVAIVEVTAEEAAADGYRYLKGKITPSNQNLTCSIIALGDVSRYKPANQFDISAVTEIKG